MILWGSGAARAFATQATLYDAIIVGGGHNGLVAAAYLAKSGKKVVVLERRHVAGGAAVTEEIVPGFKFSRASYVYSLFRPQIVKDLNLHEHGLKLLPRVPSSWTPSPDSSGRSLLLGGGQEADLAEIAKFSKKDAEAYPRYNALLDRYSDVFRPLLDQAPPDPGLLLDPRRPLWQRIENAWDGLAAARRMAGRGRELPGFIEFLTAPASKILDRWFESPVLKATLGTDAIIGAMVSPSTPSSAYVLLHHVMCGVWHNVQGGMGALTQAIAAAATKAGAEIRLSTSVKRILIEKGSSGSKTSPALDYETHRVTGVELDDGTVIHAPRVLSNAAPQVTCGRLLDGAAASLALPPDFNTHIKTLDSQSGSVKINVALDRLPSFKCSPNTGDGNTPMPHHRGTIHFETHPGQIEAAYSDARAGRFSSRPVIEMTLPSALDPTIAPPGKHVALLFCQYAPYDLHGYPGGWDGVDPTTGKPSDARQRFVDNVFNVIEEFAPGFKASVVGTDVLAPPDLERIFGLPSGNIFHASMGLDQLFWLRPAPGWSRYRTPIEGLYMAGAGAHPGGGVMGAPGRNAALTCLNDMSRNRF